MELTASIVLPARIDPPAVTALAAALDAALRGPARVVVLTGASPDVFCHGLAIDTASDGAAATAAFADLFVALHRAPKPLLAAVDGAAIGGGLGLACACDWVVATDRATFGLPELLWGLVPAIIWPAITDRMAPHVARAWTISAHARTAAEAQPAGLVDDLVPADALDGAVRRGARTLSRLEPRALVRLRAWARDSRALPLADAVAEGARITGAMMIEPHVQARWRAFAEGEVPWSA